jgi:type IV pilus assembly protein PilA
MAQALLWMVQRRLIYCAPPVTHLIQERLLMKSIQKGFTLIELMIVVAIIGILAAIAIPAYQDYQIRAQVTEALNVVGGLKVGVEEFASDKGTWPVAIGAAATNVNIDAPYGKYVDNGGVVLGTGSIEVTFGVNSNAKIKGLRLDMVPYYSQGGGAGNIIWQCGLATAPVAPATTADGAGTAATAQGTTVNAKYLPSACRP